MNILLIEDEPDIAELIAYNLQQADYEVTICHNGRQGLSRARLQQDDLIILDLMLPDLGGLEICKVLKADTVLRTTPILMLTAKGDEIDRIVGFEVGADDYLTKPFSPRELVLRVNALLRRTGKGDSAKCADVFSFGTLEVDFEKVKVTVAGAPVRLTALELKLLQFLFQSQGRVLSRDILLDRVWGYEAALTTRTVDVHIKRLRKKLGEAGAYIETVRGLGYRFTESSN
jgi:two-component system phosphate regulon response regulator PhoB